MVIDKKGCTPIIYGDCFVLVNERDDHRGEWSYHIWIGVQHFGVLQQREYSFMELSTIFLLYKRGIIVFQLVTYDNECPC